MRVFTYSEARNNLKQIIDDVVDDADIAIIARRNAPDAVLMSMDTYHSLNETAYLKRSPANAAHLTRSIKQLETGRKVRRKLSEDEG